jgi:hypothetical protein
MTCITIAHTFQSRLLCRIIYVLRDCHELSTRVTEGKSSYNQGLRSTYWSLVSGQGRVYNYNYNSVALVRERTIPAERPPLVSHASYNFCG